MKNFKKFAFLKALFLASAVTVGACKNTETTIETDPGEKENPINQPVLSKSPEPITIPEFKGEKKELNFFKKTDKSIAQIYPSDFKESLSDLFKVKLLEYFDPSFKDETYTLKIYDVYADDNQGNLGLIFSYENNQGTKVNNKQYNYLKLSGFKANNKVVLKNETTNKVKYASNFQKEETFEQEIEIKDEGKLNFENYSLNANDEFGILFFQYNLKDDSKIYYGFFEGFKKQENVLVKPNTNYSYILYSQLENKTLSLQKYATVQYPTEFDALIFSDSSDLIQAVGFGQNGWVVDYTLISRKNRKERTALKTVLYGFYFLEPQVKIVDNQYSTYLTDFITQPENLNDKKARLEKFFKFEKAVDNKDLKSKSLEIANISSNPNDGSILVTLKLSLAKPKNEFVKRYKIKGFLVKPESLLKIKDGVKPEEFLASSINSDESAKELFESKLANYQFGFVSQNQEATSNQTGVLVFNYKLTYNNLEIHFVKRQEGFLNYENFFTLKANKNLKTIYPSEINSLNTLNEWFDHKTSPKYQIEILPDQMESFDLAGRLKVSFKIKKGETTLVEKQDFVIEGFKAQDYEFELKEGKDKSTINASKFQENETLFKEWFEIRKITPESDYDIRITKLESNDQDGNLVVDYELTKTGKEPIKRQINISGFKLKFYDILLKTNKNKQEILASEFNNNPDKFKEWFDINPLSQDHEKYEMKIISLQGDDTKGTLTLQYEVIEKITIVKENEKSASDNKENKETTSDNKEITIKSIIEQELVIDGFKKAAAE